MKYWIIGLSIYFAFIFLRLYIKSDFISKWIAPAIALFFIVQFLRLSSRQELDFLFSCIVFGIIILIAFSEWFSDYGIPWFKKWHKEEKEKIEENRW